MVTLRLVALVLLPSAATGCSSPGPGPMSPVTVEGNIVDVQALAGSWRGEYVDTAHHRSGQIEFQLSREGTMGYGRVTFTAPPAVPTCPELTKSQPSPAEPVPTVLRIARLTTSRGSIGGWLAPYRDEERGCLVDTWFSGRRIRDRIEGMFFSRALSTDSIRIGTWWATRSP